MHLVRSADLQPERRSQDFVWYRLRFRIDAAGARLPATLRATADAAYRLFLNGRCVGSGPHRGFNDGLTVERHELGALLRPGENELCALVRHLYLDTFGYLRGAPVFGCEGVVGGVDVSTGAAPWRCRRETRLNAFAPRVNLHLGPLEDQRLDRDGPLAPPAEEPWSPVELVEDAREPSECPLPPLEHRRIELSDAARVVGVFDSMPRLRGTLFRLGTPGRRGVVTRVELKAEAIEPSARVHVAVRGAGAVISTKAGRRSVAFPHGHHAGEGVLVCSGAELRAGVDLIAFDAETLLVGATGNVRPCSARLLGEGRVEDAIGACRELVRDPDTEPPSVPVRAPRELPEEGEDDAYAWGEMSRVGMRLRPECFAPGCKVAKSGVVLDLGAFYFGHLELEFLHEGTGEARVEIGYGHETDESGAPLVFTWARARVAARRGVFRNLFCARGARYLFLSSEQELVVTGVAVTEALAPAPGPAHTGWFVCDDKAWERVWRSGRETLRYSRTDIVSSDNFREFCAWLGDTHWICLNYFYSFFDPAFIRHTWSLYAKAVDREGRMPSVVPGYAFFNLPAWTWQFWMGVWEQHLYAGDLGLLKEVWPACRATHRYYQRFKTPEGVLHEPEGWRIVDWARIDLSGESFVLNALYHRALGSLLEIARALDRPEAAAIREERERLRTALASPRFLDSRVGLFRDRWSKDAPEGGTFSQHAQILAYGLGLWDEARQGDLLDAILGARVPMCTLGESSYHWACDILGGHPSFPRFMAVVRRAYLHKLREGVTCLGHRHPGSDVANPFERNNSPAHGWAAAPVYISGSRALGVVPLEPAYGRVAIRPRPLFPQMKSASGAVPTPRGPIRVEWEISSHAGGRLEIALPEGMPGLVELEGWPAPVSISGLSALGDGRYAITAARILVRFRTRTEVCAPALSSA